jgi:alpha-beta hydrolase superfamily lysophospholipase/SAM-dependent methyltransferase
MTTWDGVELFYRAWHPEAPSDRALLLFHRGHEHSGRMQELVDELAIHDAWVFAWDARGHGRSPGECGYAESFATYERDVEAFVRFIGREYAIPVENMVVLAHSVGAVVVSAWVHDFAPRIRAMVLAAPAFRVKLYVPFAIPLLRLRKATSERPFVKSYVKARMLTHDPEQAARYHADEFVFRQIAVNILLGLYEAATRVMADAGAIRVPTQVLSAGSDWVVRVSAQRKFFEGLASAYKEMRVFPGFYHAIFHERDRHLPIGEAKRFIAQMLRTPRQEVSLLHADRRGYTKDEYERLTRPLRLLSPRGLYFGFARLLMKTLGRLSEGIRTGWRYGFDSGVSLDYVYENRARGLSPLGRVIDRLYLQSVGWQAIRQRKVILERILRNLVGRVHAERGSVRVLDVAAGPGRYVLETLAGMRDLDVSALLRDFSETNVEAGRELARRMDLLNTGFEWGDAFSREALAAITPKADVAIVSGLYELFPDNGPVLDSLRGLRDAVAEDGYLIYTNQPWHPQLEQIARVLANREGKPWVMRPRVQAEMDELVRAAGFEKLEMDIDERGIFTVSVARKTGPAARPEATPLEAGRAHNRGIAGRE